MPPSYLPPALIVDRAPRSRYPLVVVADVLQSLFVAVSSLCILVSILYYIPVLYTTPIFLQCLLSLSPFLPLTIITLIISLATLLWPRVPTRVRTVARSTPRHTRDTSWVRLLPGALARSVSVAEYILMVVRWSIC